MPPYITPPQPLAAGRACLPRERRAEGHRSRSCRLRWVLDVATCCPLHHNDMIEMHAAACPVLPSCKSPLPLPVLHPLALSCPAAQSPSAARVGRRHPPAPLVLPEVHGLEQICSAFSTDSDAESFLATPSSHTRTPASQADLDAWEWAHSTEFRGKATSCLCMTWIFRQIPTTQATDKLTGPAGL